jgi:hypothetical protein
MKKVEKKFPEHVFVARENEGTTDEYLTVEEQIDDFDLNRAVGKKVAVYKLVEVKVMKVVTVLEDRS